MSEPFAAAAAAAVPSSAPALSLSPDLVSSTGGAAFRKFTYKDHADAVRPVPLTPVCVLPQMALVPYRPGRGPGWACAPDAFTTSCSPSAEVIELDTTGLYRIACCCGQSGMVRVDLGRVMPTAA